MLPKIYHQVIRYARRVRMVFGGCTMAIPLYIPVRLYPGRHPLGQPSLLWALGATGDRTTAVYNPKYDTASTMVRNVGTGICHIGGRLMGQRGKTRTYPLMRYTSGIGYPCTQSLADNQFKRLANTEYVQKPEQLLLLYSSRRLTVRQLTALPTACTTVHLVPRIYSTCVKIYNNMYD